MSKTEWLLINCDTEERARATLAALDAVREEPKIGTRIGKGHLSERSHLASTTSQIQQHDQGWHVMVPAPLHRLFPPTVIYAIGESPQLGNWRGVSAITNYQKGDVFEKFMYLAGFFREYLHDLDPNLEFNLIAIERTLLDGHSEQLIIDSFVGDRQEWKTSSADIEDVLRSLEQDPTRTVIRLPVSFQSEINSAYFMLTISTSQWARYPALRESTHLRGVFDSFPSALLFVLFAHVVANELGSGKGLEYDPHQSRRFRVNAARGLLAVAVARLHSGARNFHLLDELHRIADMTYEHRETRGFMVFADPQDPGLEWAAELRTPIPLLEHRRVRKLLETSSGDFGVVCDSYAVYGLARHRELTDPRIVTVQFPARGRLRLVQAGQMTLLETIGGDPIIPSSAVEFEKLRKWLSTACPTVRERTVRIINELAYDAALHSHGTSIVVCADAAAEVARLSSGGFPIKPIQMRRGAVRDLTTIDGAILVDLEGICHGIGIILDGLTEEGVGDSSRGARFNSLARYVCARRKKGIECAAIVVSADGPVTLLPTTDATTFSPSPSG